MKPSGARTAAEAARQQRRQIQFQVPNRTRSQEVSVRCRQSRACSTRHTSSYSPVILSWRPGALLSPTPAARPLLIRPCNRHGPSLRVTPPPAPKPLSTANTSPRPRRHLPLASAAPPPPSTWTILIGRRETLTRPLGPRMWPSPARGGTACGCELAGPETERAPSSRGGRGADAGNTRSRTSVRRASSWLEWAIPGNPRPSDPGHLKRSVSSHSPPRNSFQRVKVAQVDWKLQMPEGT